MQTADKLSKAVSTWQRNDSHSARISRQKLHLKHKVQADIRLRSNLVEPAYKFLSISRQCKLLGISRSRYYYEPSSGHDEKDFNLLVKIKEVQIEHPYYGYRRIWREINKNGGDTTETTVRRVMRRFGITAVFPGKRWDKDSISFSKQNQSLPIEEIDKLV